MLWLPTLCLLSLLFGAIVEAVKKTKKMQALEQQSTVDNSWDNCQKTFMMYSNIQKKVTVNLHYMTSKNSSDKSQENRKKRKPANIHYKYSSLGTYLVTFLMTHLPYK